MKLPEDRICPNNWECEYCKYDRECMIGNYHVETGLKGAVRAAGAFEWVIQGDVIEREEKGRGTWADHFLKMDEDERWEDYRKYHEPSLMYKVPIPAGEGKPGGGCTMKVKKSKKGNKPTVYIWGEG